MGEIPEFVPVLAHPPDKTITLPEGSLVDARPLLDDPLYLSESINAAKLLPKLPIKLRICSL